MADASDASEEEAARAILSVSPLIKDVGFIKGARKGVYARLWCKACHPGRDSEQMNVTLTRTTLSACATELLRLINEKHGTHLAAAEEARAAAALEAAAAAGPSAPTTAFEALGAAQLVAPAVEAANAAEQLAKEARQAKHAAEQVLEAAARRAEEAETEAVRLEQAADDARLMAGLGRKKARVEDADAEPSWRSWTLSKFNELETKEQNRRSQDIHQSRTDIVAPKQGGDETRGWFKHWRRGVYGALVSWADGSLGVITYMLGYAARHFGVVDQVIRYLGGKTAMTPSEVRAAEDEKTICDLLEAGFAETQHCRTEQQRVEHHIGLAFVAPVRDSGMIARIGTRLGVHWGTRKKLPGQEKGRPLAFDQAIDRRAVFNAAVKLQRPSGPWRWRRQPLQPGDSVLSHGDACELTRIVVADGEEEPEMGWPCVLTFREGGAMEEKSYDCMFGKGTGSARLQRPPPILTPPSRETRNDATSDETRSLIRTHALELCAVSPHKRDQKRRHVAPRLWVSRSGLILLMPTYALYALFNAKQPGLVKLSQYKYEFNVCCWEAIHAYREGCLCRSCFNYRLYREGLALVAKLLSLLLQPPPNDAATIIGDDDATPWQPDPGVQRLHDFCCLTLMDHVGNELVCAPCLQDADSKCIRGDCDCCGFTMWTKLRPKLVDSFGKLKPDISKVWLTKMQWDRLKTGGDGSSSEDDLRQARDGTVIELLDELKPIQDAWVPHRFNIVNAKIATRECSEHMMPGMNQDSSDWSENGEIVIKRQLQQEYWEIAYYSMLISIWFFLLTAVWKDRESLLSSKAKVTVELEGASEVNGTKAGAGSYFATVESGPDSDNQYVVVRGSDSERVTVPRALLRHRKGYRIAFVQITNDKMHDGFASQAFARRRLQFAEIWSTKGRAAALDFARDDLAEKARASQQATIDAARAAAVADADAAAAAAASATASLAAATTAAAAANDPDNDTMPPLGNDDDNAAAAVAAAKAAKAAADEAARVAMAAAIAAAARAPSAYEIPVPRAAVRAASHAHFTQWLHYLDTEKFWAWIQHSDNATHFKSKENLYFWSQQLDVVPFLKAVWVEFGCPGHGKGPWDGIGAMIKTKVSKDITDEQCRTPSGRITTPLCVAQHVRATFCTDEWLREHAYMEINEVIVMYLGAEQIERPRVPPTISPVVGIQSMYSFFMLQKGILAARQWSCWCDACARVWRSNNGAMGGANVEGTCLVVPGCKRQQLTVWRQQPTITCSARAGIATAKEFEKELVGRLLKKGKPGLFGSVQADTLWSKDEQRHLRAGHHWIFEFGDAGDGSCIEKTFELAPRQSEEYKGFLFYNGNSAIVVKRWFHRVDDDASGRTFVEYNPATMGKKGAPPVELLFNSCKLRGVFSAEKFKALVPPALEGAGRTRTRGAAVRELQGVSEVRHLLAQETDDDVRHACVQAGATTPSK